MTHYYLHFNFFHKFFYCKWRIWCKFLASSSGIVVWYTWKSWHTYLSYFLAYFLSYLSGRLSWYTYLSYSLSYSPSTLSWYTYLSYILPYFSGILYWYTMYLSVILLQYFSDTLYVMLFWQLHVIPIWHTVLVYVSVILLLFFFWHTLGILICHLFWHIFWCTSLETCNFFLFFFYKLLLKSANVNIGIAC